MSHQKLKKLADAQGITILELIEKTRAVEKTEFRTATALGVYPNTIRYHLKAAAPAPSGEARAVRGES